MERTRLAKPHFTIRDLLWLTVVVALVLALIYTKQPSAAGRYQLILPQEKGGYLIDTVTGKVLVSDRLEMA
jgi:hypothetical protein